VLSDRHPGRAALWRSLPGCVSGRDSGRGLRAGSSRHKHRAATNGSGPGDGHPASRSAPPRQADTEAGRWEGVDHRYCWRWGAEAGEGAWQRTHLGCIGRRDRCCRLEACATNIVPLGAEVEAGRAAGCHPHSPNPSSLPAPVVYCAQRRKAPTRRELGRDASSDSGFGENPSEGAGLPEGGASSCRVMQVIRSRRERISGSHPAMEQHIHQNNDHAASRLRVPPSFGRLRESLPRATDAAAMNPRPAGPTATVGRGSAPEAGLGMGDWRRR